MMQQLSSLICRVLFVLAFVLAGFAVWERVARVFGYTVFRGAYEPWRLLEFSAIVLLFVVALQLREIKVSLRRKGIN